MFFSGIIKIEKYLARDFKPPSKQGKFANLWNKKTHCAIIINISWNTVLDLVRCANNILAQEIVLYTYREQVRGKLGNRLNSGVQQVAYFGLQSHKHGNALFERSYAEFFMQK
jgi:hypothetical protein